jgi:hypothetical protein
METQQISLIKRVKPSWKEVMRSPFIIIMVAMLIILTLYSYFYPQSTGQNLGNGLQIINVSYRGQQVNYQINTYLRTCIVIISQYNFSYGLGHISKFNATISNLVNATAPASFCKLGLINITKNPFNSG